MEGLGLNTLFAGAYVGRKVLLSGHTGFKGSWLAMWLRELGANVTGISLSPESTPNHWGLLHLDIDDRRLDIRNEDQLKFVFAEVQPDIVFHLAAQPLVRKSYREPLTTWATNVQGTANMLEACRQTSSVQAIVVVTSDKCYQNKESQCGYHEDDRLGGYDPYSASKAAAELVSASFRQSFFDTSSGPLLATARAGNVIGGGDWSEDRLIPDLVRAACSDESLAIRSPHAIRAWQYVLDALAGYLLLGQRLLEKDKSIASAWNFGPNDTENMCVEQVLELVQQHWRSACWHVCDTPQAPHESSLLQLNSAKARMQLNWQPVWDLPRTVEQTVHWYRRFLDDGQVVSRLQLEAYVDAASAQQQAWVVQ